MRSTRKLGLTGTPIANKIDEFWVILRCVGMHTQHDVGTHETFVDKFARPLQAGMKRTATH